MNTKEKRIKELETKAKELFIENSNWEDVLEMLSLEENAEYNKLVYES